MAGREGKTSTAIDYGQISEFPLGQVPTVFPVSGRGTKGRDTDGPSSSSRLSAFFQFAHQTTPPNRKPCLPPGKPYGESRKNPAAAAPDAKAPLLRRKRRRRGAGITQSGGSKPRPIMTSLLERALPCLGLSPKTSTISVSLPF